MRRWHSETALMLRRQRVCQWIGRDMPMGETRKRHPLDCGTPGCLLCHFSKFYRRPSRHNEREQAIRFESEAS